MQSGKSIGKATEAANTNQQAAHAEAAAQREDEEDEEEGGEFRQRDIVVEWSPFEHPIHDHCRPSKHMM